MSKSIYILGTSPNSIINFRGDLIQLLKSKGINVTAVSSISDAKSLRNIVQLGAEYKDIYLKRNNLNLIDDVKTLSSLLSLFRSKNPPHLILVYGVKLVVWGGLSARITSIPFFALITGLGFAFQGESLKRKLLTKLVVFLYKLALKNSKSVIFQNEDNLNIFVDKGIVPRFKTHVVNGSGVDIKKYNVVDFAWHMPMNFKIRNGESKWALRQILYKYIPKEMIERPKMGFSVPIGVWLRGPLREWAEDLLDESRLRQEGFFDPTVIRKKWMEHLSGARDWQHQLWSVLMFQAWLEEQG